MIKGLIQQELWSKTKSGVIDVWGERIGLKSSSWSSSLGAVTKSKPVKIFSEKMFQFSSGILGSEARFDVSNPEMWIDGFVNMLPTSSKGRNNFSSITKSKITAFFNGTGRNVSLKTGRKMFGNSIYENGIVKPLYKNTINCMPYMIKSLGEAKGNIEHIVNTSELEYP